eukprot:SAG31_NODE_19726_length_593_cov_0.917004_1_plen_63_part_01
MNLQIGTHEVAGMFVQCFSLSVKGLYLGEKAAENTFEWESIVRSGSQVDSSTQALPPRADQLS